MFHVPEVIKVCVLQGDNVNRQENEVATKQTPVDVKRGRTTLGRLVGIMSRPVGQSEPSRTISTSSIRRTTHNAQRTTHSINLLYVGQHSSSDAVAIIRVVELGARGRSGPAYLGEGISDIPSIPAQSIPTSYPSILTSSP